MKIKIFILVLLVIVSSCYKSQSVQKELEIELKKIPSISAFNFILIVPGLGCQGCISSAEKFITENINRKEILFILTSIESLKVAQNRLGIDLRSSDNVLLDFDNRFLIRTDDSIYPILIVQNKGAITSLDYLKPNSNVLIDDIFKSHIEY